MGKNIRIGRMRQGRSLRSVWLLLVFGCSAFAVTPICGQSEATSARMHTVQRGENLTHLARKYGLSVHDLASANHLSAPGRLTIGMRLLIPAVRKEKITLSVPKETTGETILALKKRTAPREVRSADIRISLNFSDVEVRQALATIADYARTDVMVTPGGIGLISLSLRGRTADEAIRLTAATAGLAVVKVGGTYIVGKSEEVKKAATEFGQTEVVTLRSATAQEAKDLLARAVPLVSVEVAGSGVVITGLPEDMAMARIALRDLETNRPFVPAPRQATEVTTLRYIEPSLAEQVLQDAFASLRVVRQERTLILIGAAETLAAATQALKQMDVEPVATPKVPEAFVYHLKYLNALTAEASLKKALPNLNVAVAPEPTSPPPAVFQPLSTNTLSGGIGGSESGGLGNSGSAQGGGQGGAGGGAGGGEGAQAQALSRSVRLILIGPAADVQQAKQLLDQTDVAPPLVRIEAALVEVNRDNMKELGIGWDFSNAKFTFTVPGQNGLDFTQNIRRDMPRRDADTAPEANFTASLKALITNNKARILANPNISVVDNEDANIFIGDLLRFPGATTTTQNATIQSIDTIPIGIALLVRPRIHPNGEVTLKVHPVVSSISGFNTVNGQSQPQTASREADTTVRLRAGEELVIGGLSRKELTSTLQKVPILGDLPIIGQLFQSRTHRTTETEILIFIRVYPVLAQPAPPDQSSLLPQDAPQRTDKSLKKEGGKEGRK